MERRVDFDSENWPERGSSMVAEATEATGGPDLQLLGWWRLWWCGRNIELGGREQRLVAFLGLRGTRPRLHVAATLWPDTSEDKALASLRAAVLRTHRRAPGLLEATRTMIGLHPDVHVDIADLVPSLGEGAVVGEPPTTGRNSILDCEELLPGWYDEWVLFAREQFEQRRLRALETMASRALAEGDCIAALEAARAASRIEPLLETARTITIQARLRLGDPAGALLEFHSYRQHLLEELGVAPSPRFSALLSPVVQHRSVVEPLDPGGVGAQSRTPNP